MPRDAEAWLADRGVVRDPIRVRAEPPANAVTAGDPAGQPAVVATDRPVTGASDADAADTASTGNETPLGDRIAEAVAFIRRSTSGAPQSEGRLRDKLAERGFAPAAIEQAIEQARRSRLVDDEALAAAMVAERRERGHAVARIRRDLRARGFDDGLLDAALADAEAEDPEAAAFAVARSKARALGALDAEVAFRRVVGHVTRRGYPDGLARKVARQAVFALREEARVAGH